MSRLKQAVVVIHGIGEQKPMETLRSFVEAVLPDTLDSDKQKYRNKPDRMSELFELRCLQVPSDHQSHRPITDFYEYYWAHHMRESQYRHVLSWLGSLIKQRPGNIPSRLRPLFFLTWGLLLSALGFFIYALLDQTEQSLTARLTTLYEKKQLYFSLLSLIIPAFISYFILGYVADAARYLTPTPDNIDERNQIRAEGIRLLRSLHESKKYFRIIIVGHSLGSVIGYDIIRHLWVDLRESHDPKQVKQELAKEFDKEFDTATRASISVEDFQQKQHKLWREHRAVGIPWLVTDFITLGSPLTYASLLMASDPQSFEQRKIEYELPCCPPVFIQGEHTHYQKSYQSANQQHPLNVRIPHHGAPFASTRWSNLFFPYKWGILGDMIGGPLSGCFGAGIKDIPLHPSGRGFLGKSLFSHTYYWKRPADSAKTESIEALKSAMRLESLYAKEGWPEPTQLHRKEI
jgi:hypothetical protein